MAKNTIIVYTDLMEQLEELSLEERGTILTAMIKYQMGEELPKMSKLLKLVFIPIRQSIDRDNASYILKCEINRKNGKLGGRPKNQTDTEKTERLNEKPKKPDNDNDTDNENDNDIDKDNDNDTESGSGSGSSKNAADAAPPTPPLLSEEDLQVIMDTWNNQCCVREIQGISETRRRKIRKLTANGIGKLLQTINDLDTQEYLEDQAKNGKKVEFDWFLNPENYQNVIEGKYKESYGKGGGHGSFWD